MQKVLPNVRSRHIPEDTSRKKQTRIRSHRVTFVSISSDFGSYMKPVSQEAHPTIHLQGMSLDAMREWFSGGNFPLTRGDRIFLS